MKVLGLNGSPRKDGNTQKMMEMVFRELESEGISTELIHLVDRPISGCRACYQCFANKDQRCAMRDDGANFYIEKMLEADGLLLGSPTYFADLTAMMKALLERAGSVSRANGDLFKRKVGAAVVAVRRGGAIHTFNSMNHFFLIGQMIIPGSCYWNIGMGLDKGDVERDQDGIKTMQVLGQNMAWLLKKIQA